MDERTWLTQGNTKPPGATAHPAEPEPNPAGRGAEPNVYITHPTHGAGARPVKTQPPTTNRKATQNADQCVHQPREVRGWNRWTAPKKKNRGEGGARSAHSHHTAHQHHKRRPNPHPDGTEDKTPQKAPRDHRAKTGNTEPRAAADRENRHPKQSDTHHAEKKKNKQQTTRPGREGMGGQRPRDPRPPLPTDRHQKPPRNTKAKPKGRGGGENPNNGNTRTPPRHRQPPGMGGGKWGTHTTARTPQLPNQEGRGTAETRAKHTRPHSTPDQGEAGYKRGAHTHTHTPQHASQE